jgi:trk system potassium uptake protein
VGEKALAIEESVQARIAFITRLGEAMLPGPGTVLQEGDVLHVIAAHKDMERIQAELATRGAPGRRAQDRRAQDRRAQEKGAR